MLTERLAAARAAGRRALVCYLTAGHPDRARSIATVQAVAAAGADVIELGVPFSDPVADGPVIQGSSQRALEGGTTLADTLGPSLESNYAAILGRKAAYLGREVSWDEMMKDRERTDAKLQLPKDGPTAPLRPGSGPE